jgi:hypothetical protein
MTLSWSPSDILVICYNEADVEPLVAAGYAAVLSPSSDDFEPMPKAGHYIIAGNGNSDILAQDLLSSGLCKPWQISLSNLGGYQDLTHVAEHGGVEIVRDIVRQSRSLFDDEAHPFARVEKPENVPSWTTGWRFLDPYLRWSESEFGVFAGPYAGGKSALAQMLACDFADVAGRARGATSSICAWEDQGWRVRRNIERFAASREDVTPMKGSAHRTADLLNRVWRLTCRVGGIRSIDWYLERCEMLVRRENCRLFVFDPWNQHDEMRDRHDTETQYVNKMLRDMTAFVAAHTVIMIIVTHISAKSYDDEGGIRPFRIAQAHGSSHFGKMADRGICIARTRSLSASGGGDRMIIRFDKAKDEESMGKLGNLALIFDRDRMDIAFDDECTEQIREAWKF